MNVPPNHEAGGNTCWDFKVARILSISFSPSRSACPALSTMKNDEFLHYADN